MVHGILPLWKPKGVTSHDCVMNIRRLFHTKKVGHTGTLDPEAEGVLPICIGKATKIASFLTETKKTYITKVKLGCATETEDKAGAVVDVKRVSSPPSQQTIENVLKLFRGQITQVPPMYSAIKVNGKKLYEYARENEAVERPQRNVFIYRLEQLEQKDSHDSFWLKVVCSKGTYIRTLCVDIGHKLGYPAHMSDLFRTGSGAIDKKDTFTFDAIETAVSQNRHKELLLPISNGLTHMARLYVNESTKKRILHGQKLKKTPEMPTSEPFLVMYDKEVLAIYKTHPKYNNMIKPVRVFNDQ
ncbi:tRNA pseudouridine synthase B [Lentibacillus persicus]|uniref:tRNA pseudouridine synthase B n=1 Tax=Lentibacillus persicus TaxID=640948 RepID=A0A1I1VF91_9BACI|nr:tRNA pseudouridine synthase B [Lentibacillus persicus]